VICESSFERATSGDCLSGSHDRVDCDGGPVEQDEGFLRLDGGIERGRDQGKSSANLMADSRAPSFAGVKVVKYPSSMPRGTVVIVSAFATLGRGTPSAGPERHLNRNTAYSLCQWNHRHGGAHPIRLIS